MKNKITRKNPQQALEELKYPVAKMILKKDIGELRAEKEAFPFFLQTEYTYKDNKEFLLFIISDFSKGWKDYIKAAVKSSDKKLMAYGRCSVEENETLLLIIEKGKAKPIAIKKALRKGKIVPGLFKNVIFEESPTGDDVEIAVKEEAHIDEIPEEVAKKSLEYTHQKQRELKIEKDLKKRPLDEDEKKKLNKEAQSLALERQKVVDVLYEQWLKDKGWEEKKPL